MQHEITTLKNPYYPPPHPQLNMPPYKWRMLQWHLRKTVWQKCWRQEKFRKVTVPGSPSRRGGMPTRTRPCPGTLNKRHCSVTAPLSNNTWFMIYSPKTHNHLNLTFQCHPRSHVVKWTTEIPMWFNVKFLIYKLLINFIHNMVGLWNISHLKLNDPDLCFQFH